MGKWGVGLAAGLAVAWGSTAGAAVIVSQASFDLDASGFATLYLPQYDGAQAIKSVTLNFTGETNRYIDVFAGDEPITLPEQAVSWFVKLTGPGIDDGGGTSYADLGSVTVNTAFPEITLPGNPGEEVTRFTPFVPVVIDAVDLRNALYAGGGLNAFEIVWDADSTTRTRGTLTVTITTVPEPATWAVMLLGFGAAGTALRRRRVALA